VDPTVIVPPVAAAKAGSTLLTPIVVVIGGIVALLVLMSAFSSKDWKVDKAKAKSKGHTDRVTVRQKSRTARKSEHACKGVCCTKRFLFICTQHDDKCYTQCVKGTAPKT